MMDIKFIRENPGIVRADLEKRKDSEKLEWLDDILAKDKKHRALLQESQELRRKRNEISEKINSAKKAGQDASSFIGEAKNIPKRLVEIEGEQNAIQKEIHDKLMRMPNILHESVPEGASAEDNVEVEKINRKPEFKFAPRDHGALLEMHGFADLDRAAKISGARFYFLKGALAEMELALQKYAVDFMSKRGFTLVYPPFMMNRGAYEGVTDLADFESVMYNVQPDNFYLIATSEHPLTAMYMNEILDEEKLPIRMIGISACFRREVGAHGKSDKGIWRVHQFNKIEQIIICRPEDSWKHHEELLKNAKDFFKSLGLHFRVVSICTGDIGIVAAKKYDLEVWIPSLNEYKEVVSCSNCTAYQATRLNMRYRAGKGNIMVHTLNSTCVATSRALVAILENFQNNDGSITIPKVLREYMGGRKVMGKAERAKAEKKVRKAKK
jgi:seryl-tRNA synthetase